MRIRERVGQIAHRVSQIAHRVYKWSRGTEGEDSRDENLNALIPARLSDTEYQLYEKEFSFIFSDSEIRNIALMGMYGAGKSTVIETWNEKQQDNNEEHVCTFISLAHFHGSNDDASAIEGEILNQLVHKTNPKRIPKSRFKHTEDSRGIIDFLKASGCVAYGALTLFLVSLLARHDMAFLENVVLMHPCLVGAWVLGLVAIVYSAFRRNKAGRFLSRIKILGNEIDLFEYGKEQARGDSSESYDSVFNKYMDDVLYLLNNSGSDVFVIEDLDRFDDSIAIGIFEKLRELNALANACRPRRLKTLRFFFMVREDLFKTPEDRVKFFDFIVPVIPFADPDGNFDELRVDLRKLNLCVSDLFVYEISAFIPDSRTLKDIVNEVKHYKEHIFRDNEKPLSVIEAEHLVAIIVYKVIFPTDFSHYQRGKGYVAELLKKRDVLVRQRKADLEEEKAILRGRIDKIDEKSRFTAEELVLTRYKDKSHFDSYGMDIRRAETVEETIEAIRSNQTASNKLDEFIGEYLGDEEKLSRLGEPGVYLEKKKERYIARIREIDSTLACISCYTIGKLLGAEKDDDWFVLEEEDLERGEDFNACKMEDVLRSEHFPLLKHLLVFDLIDDSSLRYVVRVRPEGLSIEDQRVLAAIQSRSPIEPSYVFEKPGDVLLRIRDEFLMVPGVQNYSLLRGILEKKDAGKLACFVSGLQRGEHVDFFLGFVLSDQFDPSVFRVMEKSFNGEIALVLDNETIPTGYRREFAHRLMCHEEYWELESTKRALLSFANSDSEFLSASENVLSGLRNNIGRFQLAFSDIDFGSADNKLLDLVYERALYEPNAILVSKWIENRFPGYAADRCTTLSAVFALTGEKIHQLVESEMAVFISSIVQSSDAPLTESEDVLVWVSNALSGNIELAEAFIARLENCTVSSLDQVKNVALKRALLSDVAVFAEKNVFDYYQACGCVIDAALASFICAHLESGGYEQADIDALSDDEGFVRAAVQSARLTDETVKIVLSGNGTALLNDFNIENLDLSRVTVAIRANRVPITSGNTKFIRDHYSSCEVALAESGIEAYLELFHSNERVVDFDEKIGLDLLKSSYISSAKKVEVAKLFESGIHIEAAYPDKLKAEIINNRFNQSDLPLLSREYEAGGRGLREAVLNRVVASIDCFASQGLSLSCGLLCAVLKDPRITADRKLELIAYQLDLDDSLIGDRASARRCFEAAGFEKYVDLIDGKRISVLGNDANSKAVRALTKRKMCSGKGARFGANGFVIVSPKGYKRSQKGDSTSTV
uniref:YobI-like P-loop NTPase domain-containing protein n=1 Tax=Muribaculaceae bacterium Z82 TaxID=2304548 RepID=A0A7C9N922_9BACT